MDEPDERMKENEEEDDDEEEEKTRIKMHSGRRNGIFIGWNRKRWIFYRGFFCLDFAFKFAMLYGFLFIFS